MRSQAKVCSITWMPAARTARASAELNGKAGGVAACVQDTGAGSARLRATGKLAVVLIEGDAEADEIADARRALREHRTSTAAGCTESSAGAQGVGNVLLDAVVGEHCGGDATLREAGVALFKPRLGDQRDRVLAARARARR